MTQLMPEATDNPDDLTEDRLRLARRLDEHSQCLQGRLRAHDDRFQAIMEALNRGWRGSMARRTELALDDIHQEIRGNYQTEIHRLEQRGEALRDECRHLNAQPESPSNHRVESEDE